MSVFIDTFEPILPHKKIKWKFIFSKLDSTGFLSRHINHVKESEEKKTEWMGKFVEKIKLLWNVLIAIFSTSEARNEEKKKSPFRTNIYHNNPCNRIGTWLKRQCREPFNVCHFECYVYRFHAQSHSVVGYNETKERELTKKLGDEIVSNEVLNQQRLPKKNRKRIENLRWIILL